MKQSQGRFEGKVAIVTGSASGIGAATATSFAKEGAKVVICDVNESQGLEMANCINQITQRDSAIFVKVNVIDPASVQALLEASLAKFGQVDILVNNAGVTRDSQLKKLTEADWDFVIDVNLKGVFNCSQAVAKHMLEQGQDGVILNASSVVGLDGNFGQTNYAATKAGVIGMTMVWARELGPKGIRVNAVAPGFIHTPMTDKMPQKILDMMIEATPLRRMGMVQDIANAYLWLASEEASFVNGAVIRVDGGLRLGT